MANRRHGAYDHAEIQPLAEKIETVLVDEHPWLSAASFQGTLRSYAWAEAQIALVRSYLSKWPGGAVNGRGDVKPAAEYLERVERRAMELRRELLLSPKSQAALRVNAAGTGLDLAKAFAELDSGDAA